jgi:LrgB-like family
MIDLGKLLHLQGPLLWLPCTLVLYAGSSTLYRRVNKAPIANPTLLTIATLVLILACSGVPYKAYFDSVAILNYLLGTAVVALALPLYRSIDRLKVRLHGAGIGRRFAGQHLCRSFGRGTALGPCTLCCDTNDTKSISERHRDDTQGTYPAPVNASEGRYS